MGTRSNRYMDQIPHPALDQVDIHAHLPAATSFGVVEELRSATSGSAFPSLVFDHWAHVTADPCEEGSQAAEIASEMRKRRGMKPELPLSTSFLHKL